MFAGDDRFFPLVIHRIRGAVTNDDVVAIRAFYAGIHARKQPFIHLVDGRTAERPDATVRTQLADIAKTTLAETKALQIANAIVLDGRLTVGVMTALRWAVPAPVPEKYFGTVHEAMAWLEGHAAARGIKLTAEARAYVARLDKDLHAAA